MFSNWIIISTTLIVFLPLFNSIISGLMSFYIGRTYTLYFIIINLITATLLSYYIFAEVITNKIQSMYIPVCTWLLSGSLNINWEILIDPLSITMVAVITTISTCIHIYSLDYMGADPHLSRFLAYLSLFTFFMLVLVTSNNFIQLFFGWEGVGICSYFLISFWYTRQLALKAAIKAVIMNRIADIFFLLGLGFLFTTFKSLNFDIIFSLTPFFTNETISILGTNVNSLDVGCLCLFLGAMGKSAQIGFHTWLPDAMEGPTPVSALLHSATMVTAGVFLILRCSPILEYSQQVLNFIAWIGGITALLAASIALVQNDIKKIIAYSTCSQLGYMFLACGFSNYHGALFHLFNHAFFKALLFLCAGSVIHSLNDIQDIRRMGGLVKLMPITYVCMVIGSLSLGGLLPLSGFFSKEIIIGSALDIRGFLYNETYFIDFWKLRSFLLYSVGSFVAFLTAFYSLRLLCLVFLSGTNTYKKLAQNIHESGHFILLPIIYLTILSIFSGYLFNDLFLGVGNSFFNESFFVHPLNIKKQFNAELIIHLLYKNIPLILSISGITLALYIFLYKQELFSRNSLKFFNLTNFLSKKWYFDVIYNKFITKTVLIFGYNFFFKILDKGLLEVFGPTGIYNAIYQQSHNFKLNLQKGYIYNYFIIFIVFFFNLLFISLLI